MLRETTSRGLCGLVCPSRTSELVPLVWESNRILTTIRRSGAHPGRGNASHRRPAPRQTADDDPSFIVLTETKFSTGTD